jgi:hypothetical protein
MVENVLCLLTVLNRRNKLNLVSKFICEKMAKYSMYVPLPYCNRLKVVSSEN